MFPALTQNAGVLHQPTPGTALPVCLPWLGHFTRKRTWFMVNSCIEFSASTQLQQNEAVGRGSIPRVRIPLLGQILSDNFFPPGWSTPWPSFLVPAYSAQRYPALRPPVRRITSRYPHSAEMSDWLNAELNKVGVETKRVNLGTHVMDGQTLPLRLRPHCPRTMTDLISVPGVDQTVGVADVAERRARGAGFEDARVRSAHNTRGVQVRTALLALGSAGARWRMGVHAVVDAIRVPVVIKAFFLNNINTNECTLNSAHGHPVPHMQSKSGT
ncbi:hypothetical protein C8F04DRAFT_1181890 [Mycena alexandri]|uniref:Uncharacterized protein n=1 Tax=Mycena alexandri TaxID=1745969 RepID=A0AAD6X1X7_9AGAR|nr:hypothetical protein C8F04DRAFT_1181890 [Mycena alexandri]